MLLEAGADKGVVDACNSHSRDLLAGCLLEGSWDSVVINLGLLICGLTTINHLKLG